jgi:hypothetical protein
VNTVGVLYCKISSFDKNAQFFPKFKPLFEKSFLVTLQNRTLTAPTNPDQPIISGIVFSYSAFLLLRTLKTAACLP